MGVYLLTLVRLHVVLWHLFATLPSRAWPTPDWKGNIPIVNRGHSVWLAASRCRTLVLCACAYRWKGPLLPQLLLPISSNLKCFSSRKWLLVKFTLLHTFFFLTMINERHKMLCKPLFMMINLTSYSWLHQSCRTGLSIITHMRIKCFFNSSQ